MTIGKSLPDGRALPTKIGACLRCGKWFNEAGVFDLRYASVEADDDVAK
jgi:hypothetical protein